jgi:hypothetical protein
MKLVDTPSPSIEILVATADSYQYAGKFLLESQCQGHEARQHQNAIDLITANFVDLDKKIVNHPDFSQWKKDQEAKKKAAEDARKEAQEVAAKK